MHKTVAGKPHGVREAGNREAMGDEESMVRCVLVWVVSMSTSIRVLSLSTDAKAVVDAVLQVFGCWLFEPANGEIAQRSGLEFIVTRVTAPENYIRKQSLTGETQPCFRLNNAQLRVLKYCIQIYGRSL